MTVSPSPKAVFLEADRYPLEKFYYFLFHRATIEK